MSEIKVGMTVFVRPTGANNTRRMSRKDILDRVKEVKVVKIGRKYFYVEGMDDKFDLETLKHTSEHHYDMQAYLTLQEIKDEMEHADLQDKLRAVFSTYGRIKLTLEQLRAIDKIITGEGSDNDNSN